jgi:hypothetical protein
VHFFGADAPGTSDPDALPCYLGSWRNLNDHFRGCWW